MESTIPFLVHLRQETARIADVAKGDLSVAVPSCPGWDLGKLVGHLGRVQRMALAVISTGAMAPKPPAELEAPPKDPDGLRAYFADGTAQLLHDLETTPKDAPCWNFMSGPQVAAFWHRRMAQEHAIHRYDAELAVHDTTPIDSVIAVDGIDEYFQIANERVLPKKTDWLLGGTLHLHATDVEGEWMVEQKDGHLLVGHGHGKGDAAIRGTASDLLLGLWARKPFAHSDFERFGSDEVVAAISALGGN